MFRCQFSGEKSDGPVYRTVVRTEVDSSGQKTEVRTKELVSGAEKPVRVVIETRSRSYEQWGRDEEGRKYRMDDTAGTEIVKELIVRARHLEAVKKKYNL